MRKGINAHKVRQLFAKIFRLFFSAKPASLEFSGKKWDAEYSANQWDYLKNLPELGRYSMITGYLSHLKPNASILEVGCGTGLLFERIRHLPYQYYKGIDISEKAIAAASQFCDAKTTFVSGNGANFLDTKKYDVIIFNEALYYFDDCLAVLKHYTQQLTPGGFFIISMVVGDISQIHWKKIEKHHKIRDGVQLTNQHGITWNCRIVQPEMEVTTSSYHSMADQFSLPIILQSVVVADIDISMLNLLKIITQ